MVPTYLDLDPDELQQAVRELDGARQALEATDIVLSEQPVVGNLIDLRFFTKRTKGILRGCIADLDMNTKTVRIRLLGKYKEQYIHVVIPLEEIRLNYYLIGDTSTFVEKEAAAQETEWNLIHTLIREEFVSLDTTPTTISHGIGKVPRIMFMSKGVN